MKDETADWLQISDSDLEMADAGMERKLYAQAIFHCQQAIEKLLKALLTDAETVFPKTHDLVELADLLQIPLNDKQRGVLTRLSDHAVRSRYPGAHYTGEEAEAVIQEAKVLRTWLRRHLKSPSE